jgi:hypothetical protein
LSLAHIKGFQRKLDHWAASSTHCRPRQARHGALPPLSDPATGALKAKQPLGGMMTAVDTRIGAMCGGIFLGGTRTWNILTVVSDHPADAMNHATSRSPFNTDAAQSACCWLSSVFFGPARPPAKQ